MANTARTLNFQAVLALYREGISYPEIARRMDASLPLIRNTIGTARKMGVDLGPPRKSGRKPATESRPAYSHDPYYRKLRKCGFSRTDAIAFVLEERARSDRYVSLHTAQSLIETSAGPACRGSL